MEQSTYSEVNNHPTCQQLTLLFLNPKFFYRVHKTPPMDNTLNRINAVQTLHTIYTFTIYFNIILLSLSRFSKLRLTFFFYIPVIFTLCTHIILLDFIILMILGEKYIVWSPLFSNLLDFLLLPLSSFSYSSQHFVFKYPQSVSFSCYKRQVYIHINQKVKLQSYEF
jgi:hypothetical protein